MNQNPVKLAFLLTASALLFSVEAGAEQVRGHFAGSSFNTSVDSNGDGQDAKDSVSTGRASLIGKYTANARVEALPWDLESFCSPIEIRLENLAHPTVITAANGDLIYGVQSDDPATYTCFNVVDYVSMHGITYLDIAGGTGRFAGAYGHVTITWSGKSIVNSSGLSLGAIFEGDMEGEIIGTALGQYDGDDD